MSHPLLRATARVRTMLALHRDHGFSMSDARSIADHVTDDIIDTAMQTVAAAKGVSVPGDGSILQQFLDFLNAHWADILAIILKLIGI